MRPWRVTVNSWIEDGHGQLFADNFEHFDVLRGVNVAGEFVAQQQVAHEFLAGAQHDRDAHTMALEQLFALAVVELVRNEHGLAQLGELGRDHKAPGQRAVVLNAVDAAAIVDDDLAKLNVQAFAQVGERVLKDALKVELGDEDFREVVDDFLGVVAVAVENVVGDALEEPAQGLEGEGEDHGQGHVVGFLGEGNLRIMKQEGAQHEGSEPVE
jgi:hypothetical protein